MPLLSDSRVPLPGFIVNFGSTLCHQWFYLHLNCSFLPLLIVMGQLQALEISFSGSLFLEEQLLPFPDPSSSRAGSPWQKGLSFLSFALNPSSQRVPLTKFSLICVSHCDFWFSNHQVCLHKQRRLRTYIGNSKMKDPWSGWSLCVLK